MLTYSMPVTSFSLIRTWFCADEGELLDTKLADRTGLNRGLSSGDAALDSTASNVGTGRVDTSHSHGPASSEPLARLRQDLIEAQRSKGALQLELKLITDEMEKFKIRGKTEGKRITELTAEKAIWNTKLRDRDEELRGKAKLLEVCPSERLLSKYETDPCPRVTIGCSG